MRHTVCLWDTCITIDCRNFRRLCDGCFRLKLIVPTEYGGLGQSWITVLQITRQFTKVDSSIAHVFSYHHLGVVIPHIFGSAEQKQRYYSETIRNNWFWCNVGSRNGHLPQNNGENVRF
ncbi:acyl-CoA dehydrogenase family protein [Nostoc sp.]|uniref:acyl-CoA dehydrogenase family protein n=1 Tax=Nostoc sp. TaxID=1180 RepID=UPI002FF8F557